MHSLLDTKATRFDHLPATLGVGLMPEADRLLPRVDRCPDVFARPLWPNLPYFVQHDDPACRLDFSQEMQPSRADGQLPFWNQSLQSSAQVPNLPTLPHLCGCLT